MGVTKKPAVIAKTASKKRGRPVGSKNKPKLVDWEKLSKQLQGALAAQIKETDAYKKLWEEFQDKIVISESLSVWKRLKLLFTGRL